MVKFHIRYLNCYSVFIPVTIGKPCFKSIKAIIGTYVVMMGSNVTHIRNIVRQGGKVYSSVKRLNYLYLPAF